MGWNICFLGFNRPPSIKTLEQIQWLKSWRLFHEPETGASFLEGQSLSETISFQEEIKTAKLALTESQKHQLENIDAEISKHGGYKELFDSYSAQIAMLLSQALNQPVASFVGDDEGTESCFIFDEGKLVRGRLEINWNKALSFDTDGNAELEWLYPEGMSDDDPDFKMTRTMYQIGVEEADAFFDRHSLEDTLSFDRDFRPGQFLLKAQKGKPDLPIRRPVDELTDFLGDAPTQKQVLAAFDPIVQAILDTDFPNAPNAHRFEMDERLGACSIYISRLIQLSPQPSGFYKGIQKFLNDIGLYVRYMRPKPEFRKKSINARGWSRQLKRKWWFQNLRSKF
jgi:hypothetical protein